MSNFISPDPKNQKTLDRADAAYMKVAFEFNGGKVASADDLHEALMAAWEYIVDSTENSEGGY